MKYLKKYNQINEGLRDYMTGLSKKQAFDKLNHLNPLEKMFRGIEYNMIELVELGIAESEDITEDLKKLDYSILRYSVLTNNLEITDLLLKSGGDVNCRDEILLRAAAFKENKKMMDLLIKHGANIDRSINTEPYEKTANLYGYKPHSVDFLKSYKNKNMVNEGLRDMMKPKSDEEIKKSLKDLPIEERLKLIQRYRLNVNEFATDEEIISFLSEHNTYSKIYYIHNYGLDKKFFPSDEKIEKFLSDMKLDERIKFIGRYNLDKKFLPSDDEIKKVINSKDILAALLYADLSKLDYKFYPPKEEIIKYFKGLSKDKKSGIFINFVTSDYVDLVKYLLDIGVDFDVNHYYYVEKSKSGFSALHLAISNESSEMARVLLNHGADPFIKDSNNKTPLEEAEYYHMNDIVDLINKKYNTSEGLKDMMKPKSDEEISKYLKSIDVEEQLKIINRYNMGDKFYPDEEEIMDYIENNEEHIVLDTFFRYNFLKGINIILDKNLMDDSSLKYGFKNGLLKIIKDRDIKNLLKDSKIKSYFDDDELYILEKYYFGKHSNEIRPFEKLVKDYINMLSTDLEKSKLKTTNFRYDGNIVFSYIEPEKLLLITNYFFREKLYNKIDINMDLNYIILIICNVFTYQLGMEVEEKIKITIRY